MASVMLKISKPQYEAKIFTLQNYLGRIDSTLTQYERLQTNMDSFIEGQDDNYANLRANVENNITMVRKAKEMTEASIRMLQDTLRDIESFSEEVERTIVDSGNLAKSTFKTSVEVIKIMN